MRSAPDLTELYIIPARPGDRSAPCALEFLTWGRTPFTCCLLTGTGARPEPYASHKIPLQLVQYLTPSGDISDEGRAALTEFVKSARDFAIENNAEDLLAFATSAIREAGNGAEVLQHVRRKPG